MSGVPIQSCKYTCKQKPTCTNHTYFIIQAIIHICIYQSMCITYQPDTIMHYPHIYACSHTHSHIHTCMHSATYLMAHVLSSPIYKTILHICTHYINMLLLMKMNTCNISYLHILISSSAIFHIDSIIPGLGMYLSGRAFAWLPHHKTHKRTHFSHPQILSFT